MDINKNLLYAKENQAKGITIKSGFWDSIMPSINEGKVIPIVSNSFRIEQIFRAEYAAEKNVLTILEQLTSKWAKQIHYPMRDKENLARVAQYYLVEQKYEPRARTKFLEYLKTELLKIGSKDPDYKDIAKRLEGQIHDSRFSEIVRQLDYPRMPKDVEDPLRLLARFPFPIYMTTSQSDFLEHVLEAEGKKPRTQICFWSGEIFCAPEHHTDHDFIPSVLKPMVYHLYGLENYPQTLVLSEDDYLNFLANMVNDTNTKYPLMPLNLQAALADSHLLLLGYQLPDWDFRVMFRLILDFRKNDYSPRGMVIQLPINKKRIENMKKYLEYLGLYFDRIKFDIAWSDPEEFIQRLWNEWTHYKRRGQL